MTYQAQLDTPGAPSKGDGAPALDRRIRAEAERIVREWMDEPTNRFSFEEGAYGDVGVLVARLAPCLRNARETPRR